MFTIRRAACDEAKGYVSHYVDATSHKYESYVLGGYLYKGIKPDRSDSSKWQLSKAAYPSDELPNYLSGTAYLLSANIVTHLLNAARHTPLIRLEDVYLTGLVARELKLRATHIDGFERFRPRFEGPCVYRNLLTAHGFAPGELRLAAQGSVGVGEGACDGVLTRLGLAVNGVVTALFPRLPAASSSLSDSDVEALI
ncbi:Beta-1,3-galactosyltransferase 5 [Chionoecetes opilio]|uniref:Hexosyltransferase n=1 Tax=Chionoecetes opilio TaxID=41210 RepID=A0A8J4XPH3_CHIOP|nr:Beta-1,3-galactosyltransferase 5 [Chionoecetes opilio]